MGGGRTPGAGVRADSGAGVGLAALWGARLLRLAIRRFPKGNEGKRVSSGYNRRRRLAPRSSGKQQAERTAVRTAPIVCPKESPLLASISDNFAARNSPWWGLTRRLRRGRRACSPMVRLIASSGDPKGVQGGERKAPSAPAGAIPCPRRGLTRRLRRGLGLAVPRGAHTFLSVAKEKCAKESQRHGDSRGGPPRFALRPSPALRLCLATRFMAFGHFWR